MKRLLKKILFLPYALTVLLVIGSTVLLILAFTVFGTNSPLSYLAYTLSAYALTVLSCEMPAIVKGVRAFLKKSTYIGRLRQDSRYRMKLTLLSGSLIGALYGIFHLALGLFHQSFWYISLCGYYLTLSLLRLYLFRQTEKQGADGDLFSELKAYRTVGRVFTVLTLFLSLMVFFMVYWKRTFYHHEITTIAMAAYTFGSFAGAIVKCAGYKRYPAPLHAACRCISLAVSSVSMLTLSSTMLTTFGKESDGVFQTVMLAVGGTVVCLVLGILTIYILIRSQKRLRALTKEKQYE